MLALMLAVDELCKASSIAHQLESQIQYPFSKAMVAKQAIRTLIELPTQALFMDTPVTQTVYKEY